MKRQAGGSAGHGPTEAIDATAGHAGTGYAGAGEDAFGGAELLEDRSVRIAGGRHGRRFGISLPGALVGTFLISALALGAALGPLAPSDPASDSTGHGGDSAVSEPTDKVDGDHPDGGYEPDKTYQPDPTEKPQPADLPAPDASEMDIALTLDGTSVVVEWSACETDVFVAYKIIRSKDEAATWPLGTGDALIGVIENQATTRFVDKNVDGGRLYHYRVVALGSWDGEKAIACRSDVAAIETPAPTPKPTLKPEPTDGGDVGLSVVIKEGHPILDWTACTGVDFGKYKVVRSTDSTVTWPNGENDAVIAVVGMDGDTMAWDKDAPGGKTLFYRVFCVRSTEAGYVVVAASAVKSVTTPVVEPAPDPVALGFEVDLVGEGAQLSWEPCTSDLFVYYKVVRSTSTDNPSYLPWAEGTELIGVIENSGTNQLLDSSVASGQTIFYRVQAIGYWNGAKFLLGQTAVIAVTIP